MQRHSIQVEATVVFNLSVDAESLDATKEQIQEVLERDLERINNALFNKCVSAIYRKRVELVEWNIRNHISYVPKVISLDDRHEVWYRLTEGERDLTEDEDDE